MIENGELVVNCWKLSYRTSELGFQSKRLHPHKVSKQSKQIKLNLRKDHQEKYRHESLPSNLYHLICCNI